MATPKRLTPVLVAELPTCHYCGSKHESLPISLLVKKSPHGDNCTAVCPVTGAPLLGTITLKMEGAEVEKWEPIKKPGKSGEESSDTP